ncbi:MAG: tripartite tricarboxylate transporter permease [Candidatus Aenigmatarchaeota archaeon]
MILEEAFIAMLIGIPLGVATGLVPGLHVNTLVAIILPFYPMLPFSNYFVVSLFASVLITHVFVSFIPSIFLGAPDPETSLSVLPGHKMLLEGRGLEAIKLTVIGSLGALIASLVLIFLFSGFFVSTYEFSRNYLHYILLAVVAYMVSRELPGKRLYALMIFMLSGILGFLVLQSSIVPQQHALFPVLSGLFGVSTLLLSINRKGNIPAQKTGRIFIGKSDLAKSILIGSLAGMVVGLLPGIGSTQATIISQQMFSLFGAEKFLVAMAGINAADSVFSLGSLHLVGNPRSGVSVAVEKVMGKIGFYDFILLLGVVACAAGAAAIITLKLSERVSKVMGAFDYSAISKSVVAFIALSVYFFTGLPGVLVLLTSASMGILASSLSVNRSHCMGVLLFPTILFFAGLTPSVAQFLGI